MAMSFRSSHSLRTSGQRIEQPTQPLKGIKNRHFVCWVSTKLIRIPKGYANNPEIIPMWTMWLDLRGLSRLVKKYLPEEIQSQCI